MRFDYVIVGAGSAGATLAARLTENPAITVCLLEAGGGGNGILTRAPIGVIAEVRDFPKINNWAYSTVPQQGLNGRKGYQPRGKALGGSSAINAMLYIRGHRDDFDNWAKIGCDGWGWDDVLPYFRKSENNQHGPDAFHGDSGPLEVSDQQEPRP
ncbi:MAG: glucose-methanol-choline oxidoreductase, partial [Alphaproteobacteria bacterium]|nr:glucose-methanol-choline oxidoreductase [Alphaproteobacteria bacterium]